MIPKRPAPDEAADIFRHTSRNPAFVRIPLPLPGHGLRRDLIRWLAPPANFCRAFSTKGLTLACVLAVICLTSCTFLSRHHFKAPSKEWQTRTGQLQYRTGGVTVAGDVVVRISKQGDFELMFSKGPGINLFTIQQDANFAEVKSSLTRQSWSGRTDQAPRQLSGWLSIREKLIAAPDRRVIRHDTGTERFVFRF
ncbi:MAG TPA: hypothetical protein VJ719_09715 [Chthoniobacterales bacterium]|nr:hypothetical protein [Chthoniobacterales bacterium]